MAEPRRYLSVRGGEWAFAVVGLPLALLGGIYAFAVLYAGALLSLTMLGLPFVVAALLGARGLGALLSPPPAQQRVRELETARATLLADNTDQLRRLERDLHDGTQARLIALAITLSLAEDALAPATAPDLLRLRTLVDRARDQTDDTVAELRRLTQGIHPAALDGGLGEALPGLTATSPVPVSVHLALRERPHPVVERTIYFCAAELLTNIAKHSGAHSAELTVSAADGCIRLVVRDDGCGDAALGTGTGTGTGLTGLAERLAAVDGVLRVDSPPGGPTVVTAELPTRVR